MTASVTTADATPGLTSKLSPEITVKVAATREERAGAFRLAYNSYHRAGLCDECPDGLRITPYQLLPTTDVIVAILRGEVISTLSLVRDGELGLPLESLYADEVRERRAAGLKLAEVSCLADRRQDAARFFGLFCELAQVMIQMADREGVDQLLIAVHPRHARMYCRAMAFRQVGEERDYDAVNGNPAVLLCLDRHYVKNERPEVWARFCGDPLPREITERRPIGAADRRYFAELVERQSPPATCLLSPEAEGIRMPALICA